MLGIMTMRMRHLRYDDACTCIVCVTYSMRTPTVIGMMMYACALSVPAI